ncbi:MAG TPA: T9SS type A sorting domain-containing protein [Bacteroidales bacterium]|nr:T9SS type A sorting domain-containing protein [Bacteroidales bacterium]
MKKITFLLLFLFGTLYLSAETCVAIKTGNWESSTTWSIGRTPTCGDSVVIPIGLTVTITTQLNYVACGGPMQIAVYGTLAFQTGKKIALACTSVIYVPGNGIITPGIGGGNSNLIDICSITLWTVAMGTITGPTIIKVDNPLPIELLSFSATYENKKVTLNWSTASEINNDYFSVERSDDMRTWQNAGNIEGAGNSNTIQNYSFVENVTHSGTFYYRLKQTDYNGSFAYFLPPFSVVCEYSSTKPEIRYYPNPFTTGLSVDIQNISTEEATFSIFDLLGNMVMEKVFTNDLPENHSFMLNLGNLPAGIYFAKFASGSYTWTTRLVKE